MALKFLAKRDISNFLSFIESGKQILIFSISPLYHKLPLKKFSFYLLSWGFLCFVFSLVFQYWVNAFVYPQNLSGKPYFSLLTAIPFSFEITLVLVGIMIFLRFVLLCFSRNYKLPSEVKQNLNKIDDDCVMIYFHSNLINTVDNSHLDKNLT